MPRDKSRAVSNNFQLWGVEGSLIGRESSMWLSFPFLRIPNSEFLLLPKHSEWDIQSVTHDVQQLSHDECRDHGVEITCPDKIWMHAGQVLGIVGPTFADAVAQLSISTEMTCKLGWRTIQDGFLICVLSKAEFQVLSDLILKEVREIFDHEIASSDGSTISTAGIHALLVLSGLPGVPYQTVLIRQLVANYLLCKPDEYSQLKVLGADSLQCTIGEVEAMVDDYQRVIHRDQLSRTPSVNRWLLELERVASEGQFIDSENNCSIVEYLKNLTTQAADPCVSDRNLRNAIERFVVEWNSNSDVEMKRAGLIIELINAYLPPSGFQRLMSFLSSHHQLGQLGPYNMMLSKALSASGRYFDAPLPYENQSNLQYRSTLRDLGLAYQVYLDMLRKFVERPLFGAYAAKSLLHHNALYLLGWNMSTVLQSYPWATRGLVDVAIESARDSHNVSQVSEIFNVCIASGEELLEKFEDAVIDLGYRLRLLLDGPYLEATTDATIEDIAINVDTDKKSHYLHIFVKENSLKQVMDTKLREVAATQDT